MSASLVVGFVPIARSTFDTALAQQTTGQVRQQLLNAGFRLNGEDRLVSSLDEIEAAAAVLNDQPLDLLLVLQATFADSTMVQELARAVRAPLLLWAVPEARTGGRLRLNSLCGINLAGHPLTRVGRAYHYLYASPGDPRALQKVEHIARAGHA